MVNQAGLEFLNRQLSGRLEIELSEPAERITPHLLNLKASPTAIVTSLRLDTYMLDEEAHERRPLTEIEHGLVVFEGPRLILRGDSGGPFEHHAPNGRSFTVRDVIAAVESTERQTRGSSDWLGGVDVHHVYFEGLAPEDDGSWSICWGS